MSKLFLSACALFAYLAAQPVLATTQTAGGDKGAAKAVAMVNLNTATAAELATLPGVGPKLAERIIEYRQKKGPFKKIEELMNVQGIGEKSFLKLRPQLTVASKTDAAGHD